MIQFLFLEPFLCFALLQRNSASADPVEGLTQYPFSPFQKWEGSRLQCIDSLAAAFLCEIWYLEGKNGLQGFGGCSSPSLLVSTKAGTFGFPQAMVAEGPWSGPNFGVDCDKCGALSNQ